jgi:hypothetical protein
MASAARSIAPVSDETGIAAKLSNPSRRGMLGIVAALPAVATSLTASAAFGADRGVNAMNMHTSILSRPNQSTVNAWDHALRSFRAAEGALLAFWQNVHNPAVEEQQRRAPYPELTYVVAWNGRPDVTYRFDPMRPSSWENIVNPAATEASRAVKAKWLEYCDRRDAAARDLGLAAIGVEEGRLWATQNEAERALFEIPAPNTSALATKMEIMWDDGRDAPIGYQDIILADVRKLAAS